MTGGPADPARRGARGWAFIDLAALGRNSGRLYAVALALIILVPLAVAALLGASAGLLPAAEPERKLLGVLLQFGPIVVAGFVVQQSVAAIHRRPWRSLIAGDLRIDKGRLAIGAAAEFAILAGQLALVHAVTGWPWRFSLGGALPAFLLGLVLIPLQAASEELLFRGYLTQALGRIAGSRVLIAAIVAIVFGLLHLTVHGPLTILYYFGLSLVFSLVSLRDERLELAIGGHAAMNLFAFVAATSGMLAPAAGHGAGSPAAGGAADNAALFNWASILVLLVNGVLFYGITRMLVRLSDKPRTPRLAA